MNTETELLEYYRIIKKWKDVVLAAMLTAIILTTAISLIMPWTYRAETTILLPDQGKGLEGIMALSSVLNGTTMSMPTNMTQSLVGRTTSYSDILRSQTLSLMVIEGLSLDRHYNKKAKDLVKKLKKNIRIKESKGLLKIYVENNDPKLAADIANYVVLALDEFNKKGNVAYAKRMKNFIFQQLAEAKTDLSLAEEKLKKFETQSQMVKISEKELSLGRYLRDVKVKEAVYTMLQQEYEKTKIEEAKEGLFFEVLDPAQVPTSPYRPAPLLYAIVSGILGLIIGVFLAFILEYLESNGKKIDISVLRKVVKWQRT